MAVFYNKEKSKIGSMSGQIISFPVEVTSEDPASEINKKLLPAGYLRCDGRVLFAEEYPLLALVLGTGGESKFKKEDQNLNDNQIQLPDLRNKHIRATTSSNIGMFNDLYVTNTDDKVIPKSGVGLDVVQNIDSPYQLTYTGNFYIPQQTLQLRGEPSFTNSTGAYTESIDVVANAFQPHMHRSTTTRARQMDRGQSHFSSNANNFAKVPSSLNVCQWWQNTNQILCYWAMTSIIMGNKQAGEFFTGPTSYCYHYGACFGVCASFIGSEAYCLWPTEASCPEVNNKNWCITKVGDSNSHGSSNQCNDTTFGTVSYSPTYIQRCVCTVAIFGECLGGANGTSIGDRDSDELENFPAQNEGQVNLPFTSFDTENYRPGFLGVSNITTTTGEYGYDGTHRHRMDFESDTPHTYALKTRSATMRADTGLVSKITIKTNTSKKADKYIQPYIITEYLIKI